MSENHTTIAGNLTGDIQITYTTAGTATGRCSIAVNRRWQKNGEWQEQTSFIDCSLFGPLAENAAASLTKGNRVLVTGRLEQSQWTDKEGKQRSSVQLVISDIGASLMFARCDIERIDSGKPRAQTTGRQQQTDTEEPF